MMSLKDISLEEAQHICQNHPRCAGCPFNELDDCILDGTPNYWADMEGDEDMDEEDSGTPSCESLHHVDVPTAGICTPYSFVDTVDPVADQTIKADAGKLPLPLRAGEGMTALTYDDAERLHGSHTSVYCVETLVEKYEDGFVLCHILESRGTCHECLEGFDLEGEKHMRVIVKEPGRPPVDKDTPNALKPLQEAVGGYIESFTIAEDLVILCDEEGWLKMKKPNCKIFGNLFVGTIIFVGVQGEEVTDCPITAEELNSPPWYGLLEEV